MSLGDDARPEEMRAMIMSMQATLDRHDELLERLTGFLSENRPMLQEIIEAVCEFYDISAGDLIAHSNFKIYAHPRLVVYYLGRKLTRLSLSNIAYRLGERDHSTIHAGFRRTCQRVHNDEILRDDIDVLRSRIAEKVLGRNGGVPS